jgi:hypothetical protein
MSDDQAFSKVDSQSIILLFLIDDKKRRSQKKKNIFAVSFAHI